jgi:hypothetical protein
MNTRIPAPPLGENPPTATFIVTYSGFTPQAQAAFQYAVNIWSALLVSSVPIRVTATWTPLNPGVLGSAGASSFYRDFPNAPQAGTWYAVALAEKLYGAELNLTTDADIEASFSSSFSNWYYGTDGNTPPGQFDLVTVVLHELGHGLTFAGSMTVSGGQGNWGLGSGFPFTFDRYAQNGAAQSLINTTLFPNPSVALATQLQSNSVFFNGPQAIVANGGTRPPLYAPASWIQGSSYSHLNESTYPAGNANSLMTPEVGMAEAIHNPGPVTLGMFRDMGWTTVAVSVEEGAATVASMTQLFQNYPNPFNPTTTIRYFLPSQSMTSAQGRDGVGSFVTLKVYDLLGRDVATLANEEQQPGTYSVQWDASNVASGMYYCRLEIAGLVQTRKLLLLR